MITITIVWILISLQPDVLLAFYIFQTMSMLYEYEYVAIRMQKRMFNHLKTPFVLKFDFHIVCFSAVLRVKKNISVEFNSQM